MSETEKLVRVDHQPLVVPLPDRAAIPWIDGIRAMVRDRQYEVTQMMDDLDPRKCPIENEAWQRVKRELETVADLCNRMIYRIHRGETGSQHNDQILP